MGSRFWPFVVTWRHRSRGHSTRGGRLTIRGSWWPCVHLAQLWRYGASNIGCTDLDTERKRKEWKEKEEGEEKGRKKESGKKRKREGEKKCKVKGRGREMERKRKKGEGKRGREREGGRKILKKCKTHERTHARTNARTQIQYNTIQCRICTQKLTN